MANRKEREIVRHRVSKHIEFQKILISRRGRRVPFTFPTLYVALLRPGFSVCRRPQHRLLADSYRSISEALQPLAEVFRRVVLPGQLQLYVSSSAHSCPPDPPPYGTAGHSSPAADG